MRELDRNGPARRWRTRLAVSAVSVALLVWVGLFAVPVVGAAPWVVDTTSRTEGQIRLQWQLAKPVYTGSAYSSAPSVVAPYAAGTLRDGFLADGLNALNFYRYLAGLPCDVTLDAGRNYTAQHGAVLLAASTFSHYPPRPADMPVAFYDIGYQSTSTSNIGYGYADLETFQRRCIDDSSAGNIAALGHRRWMLNPPMKVTGMGYASARATTYALDRSRTESVSYDKITWPCAGFMPVEVFGSSVPWSITLNPSLYAIDSAAAHMVTLRRVADGRTWTFNASDTNTSGEYFNYDSAGYGVGNCFVFRPLPSSVVYKAGDRFEVTLSGGITRRSDGSAATISYTTTFMSLAGEAEMPNVSGKMERLDGANRYAAGVSIAREAHDPAGTRTWPGVTDIVIASGDDRAAADPLAASGLCWLYDAPLFLVSAKSTPAEVLSAVREIVTANATTAPGGTIDVHIVGGTTSVPDARYSDIARYVGSTKVAKKRVLAKGSRYDLAAAIARRMWSAAPAEGKTPADAVLIANGADPAKFFDALALSPVAAAQGTPILLVSAGSVPAATANTLAYLRPSEVFIGGGTQTVSTGVYREVGAAARWSGATRYSTAIAIADRAVAKGWLDRDVVGVAARLPDAVTGGAMLGAKGGPLVLTKGTALTAETAAWLGLHRTEIDSCYVLGGPASLGYAVESAIDNRLVE